MNTALPPDHHEALFSAPPLRDHRWDGCYVHGEETVEALRALASAMSAGCPCGQCHARCPFRWLEQLELGQREELLDHMDRNALLQLFAMEQACRFEAALRQG